jgi:hypothetical protein
MPLDPTQHQLFRRTFLSLLEFVNERLHVIADQRLVHGDEDDISRLGLVARELWNHPELAHVFASEHREELGDDELQCVAQLADALYDDFVYEETRDGYAVFVHDTGTYLATSADTSTSEGLPSRPAIVRTALVPFQSQILAVLPLFCIGNPTGEYRRYLAEQANRRHATQPTAQADDLARRARAWRMETHTERRANRQAKEQPAATGFHVGALASLVGTSRQAAIDEHFDQLAYASDAYDRLLAAHACDAPDMPASLRDSLDLLDDDQVLSTASHLDVALLPPELDREELVDRIVERMPRDEALRDLTLAQCDLEQFELLQMLLNENPQELALLPPHVVSRLQPLMPYSFVLRVGSHVVAWMPPEIHRFLRDADHTAISTTRRRLLQASRAADAMGTMYGIVSLPQAYACYRDVAHEPLDADMFEHALTVMEHAEMRTSYSLWSHEGTTYLISADLSCNAALVCAARQVCADIHEVDEVPEPIRQAMTPEVVVGDAERVELLEAFETEMERRRNRCMRLLASNRRLPLRPLLPRMLEMDFIEYLEDLPALAATRSYLDRHIPDDEDDYLFATSFVRALIISTVFEEETYEETLDVIRLFGLRRCEGEVFPHALGQLVTDVFNTLPRWDLNGWSLRENTDRLMGKGGGRQAA